MIQTKRRWVQALSMIGLHGSWGPMFSQVCNPVLSCHSCALAWFVCPVGAWVHYSGWHLFPYVAIGTTLLLGVLIGRLLCGWVCPFGFVQDLLYMIPSKKLTLPKWTSHLKYLALLLFVFLFPWFWGESTLLSFCRACPASALEVTVPRLIGGAEWSTGVIVKMSVLVGVLGLAVVAERSFCKTMCPIGAFLAPLNFLSFWKVRWPTDDCLSCKKCNKSCPTNVEPSSRIDKGIPANHALDCIVCHQCQPGCPQRDD